MSVFASLGIILLAMLIQAFLQTSPGVFAIFYHHALGKTSAKKADDRSLSFILGVEIFIAIIFLISYFIATFVIATTDFNQNIFLWVMAGVFFTEAIITFFVYFKIGKKSKKATKLFLPRHIAESFIYRAEHAKNRTDTIILGVLTSAIELIFTLPLFIISSVEILKLSPRFGFVFIIAYIVIATIPLFTIRTLYKTGHNLAEIQRLRVKKKNLFRFIISISYLALAVITLILGVYNGI